MIGERRFFFITAAVAWEWFDRQAGPTKRAAEARMLICMEAMEAECPRERSAAKSAAIWRATRAGGMPSNQISDWLCSLVAVERHDWLPYLALDIVAEGQPL